MQYIIQLFVIHTHIYYQLGIKKVAFSPLLVFLTFFPVTGFANCNLNLANISSSPNITFNQDSVGINMPLGNEIISTSQTVLTCDTTSSIPRILRLSSSLSSNPIAQINSRNIYATTNPAVGYAIGIEPTNFCTSAGTAWLNASALDICAGQPISSGLIFDYRARTHLQFYKLAKLISSNNIQRSSQVFVELNEKNNYTAFSLISFNSFSMTIPTCALKSASITNINLPTLSIVSLPSQGSRAGNTPFNIIVNCPSLTKLNITFTDNNKIGQTTNILTPAATSTAKGVGIQLQYNGNIISFGPDSADPGTTNQILLNSNLIGTQTFPFTASYIRTGTVTPGSLTATSTFTLSYQ
ncbi:fimbrial protein [Aquitalea denitrificans]|uniref:fimbrial protein n=1 Tax=Aquitalea denitrificans TaxID=519081 RepID=UPI00135C4840|nr:fimbrial protein [Aquitalea denitrificans]